ncbi:unnamed protein product [Durusdinium trenchii]|uniref:Uncharacterized protein n=1 Tax=Durusdinium trenchii TaxID=1381693 RepID=A0ABP0PHQ1_9DINO
MANSLPSGALRPPVAIGPLLDDEPELYHFSPKKSFFSGGWSFPPVQPEEEESEGENWEEPRGPERISLREPQVNQTPSSLKPALRQPAAPVALAPALLAPPAPQRLSSASVAWTPTAAATPVAIVGGPVTPATPTPCVTWLGKDTNSSKGMMRVASSTI